MRILRVLKRKATRNSDSPHRVALAAALGVFVACTPLLGLHLVVVLLLASMLRVSRLIAFLFVWVNNPLTVAAIYCPAYAVGRFLCGAPIEQGATPSLTTSFVSPIFTSPWWRELMQWIMQNGVHMWVGCIVIGLCSAFFVYSLIRLISQRCLNTRTVLPQA